MALRTAILVGIAVVGILSACSDNDDESRSGSLRAPVAPPVVNVVSLTPEGEEIIGGSCDPSSAVSRPNAWRCSADMIYDPCFSEADGGAEVICGTSAPWDAMGVRVILDEPLPTTQVGEDASKVWGIELSDGTRCSWLGGATVTVEGARVNYECGDDWFIVGSLRVEPPWIARLVQFPTASEPPVESQDVPIVTVWR